MIETHLDRQPGPVSAAQTQAVLLFLIREPFEDEFLLLCGDKASIHQLF